MNDLNFFSEYIAQRKKTYKKSAVIYAMISLILLSVISSYVITEIIASRIQSEITSLEEYLNDRKTLKQLKEIEDLKQKLDILSQYHAQLDASQKSITKLDVIKSTLLEKFNTALPGEVVMSSLEYTPNNIAIKGTADSRITVAELSYNLNALGIFTEVHVSKIANDNALSDFYQFEAGCKLKGVINP